MRRAVSALLLATLGAAVAWPPSSPAQPWSPEDRRAAGRLALSTAENWRVTEAQAIAQVADPLARKIVTWMRLQMRGQATAAELSDWLLRNPDWPLPELIARRAEEALVSDVDDALALRQFSRFPPRGLDGAQRYADALNRAGRGAEATPVLRAAWVAAPADPVAEPGFLVRNASILSAADQQARFDRLATGRDSAAAAQLLSYLDPSHRLAAEARLALMADRADAESLLPPPEARDLGLSVEYARWLRRKDRDAEAAAVWQSLVSSQHDLPPDMARGIWSEREVLARKLIRLGDAPTAYAVASAHGQVPGTAAHSDAEFLAGWTALRRLNDPAAAAGHFRRVAERSTSVITRARAAYWQGRALAAQGQDAAARAQWEAAATLPTAFYGQLASLALGETPSRLAERVRTSDTPVATADQAQLFLGRELPRAVLTLADLGDSRRALTFLLRLESLSSDAPTRVLVADLADTIGRPDQAVWVSRRAAIDGVAMVPQGWPTPYPTPAEGPEPALVRAISRQESNFDPLAVSPSNARGLMQLLPATAAEVARQNGIAHQLGWLTADPAYNMRLGSLYLSQQLLRFGNNPALAAAAYNAGPRRVAEWQVTYGDPTAGTADMIDWIELIPFSETRNYVQRVIENIVVYRALDAAAVPQPHPLASWLRS